MALAVELDAELLADMLEGLGGDRVATAAMLEQQGAPDIALIRRQVPCDTISLCAPCLRPHVPN
eukprot:COSAG01_NODE_1043_length_11954_cov_9.077014_9_plen_64_part_00